MSYPNPQPMVAIYPAITAQTLAENGPLRRLFNQGISDHDQDAVDMSCFDSAYLAGVMYARTHRLN